MKAFEKYFEELEAIVKRVKETQGDKIMEAAQNDPYEPARLAAIESENPDRSGADFAVFIIKPDLRDRTEIVFIILRASVGHLPVK